MGMLQEGRGVGRWYDTKEAGVRFVHRASEFRNWITPDGAPGPRGGGGSAAEAGRHRLHVSLACPWAHRVLIFRAPEGLEDRLATMRYLTGKQITEADWRLFTTLVRFEPVHVGYFKCDVRRIADYPNLSGHVRDLYQQPGVAAAIDMRHIKGHYYASHESIRPSRIVPLGPVVDYS